MTPDRPREPSARETGGAPRRGSTSRWTPGVDYHASSDRIAYDALPAAVRATVTELLGSPVADASPPVGSGFTRAYAGTVRLRDGRRLFLKASGPERPIPVAALTRELAVLREIGHLLPAVPLVAGGPSPDGGAVLALAWIDGHLPGFPWTGADVDAVHRTCADIAALPAAAVAGLAPGRLHTDFVGDDLARAIAGERPLPFTPRGLPGWLLGRLPDVLRTAGRFGTLVGDHVNHHDLRPDNLLVGRVDGTGEARVFVLDWNWLTLGPAWCDWVGLVPTMTDQGHDLRALLDRPVSAGADREQVSAWLAVVAAYMLHNLDAGPPPGTTTALREHQRYYARIFLDALAAHEGWA